MNETDICVCGDVRDEHGQDPEFPGSSAWGPYEEKPDQFEEEEVPDNSQDQALEVFEAIQEVTDD